MDVRSTETMSFQLNITCSQIKVPKKHIAYTILITIAFILLDVKSIGRYKNASSQNLVQCLPNQINIGILLTEDQIEQGILFKWAIEQINSNRRSILTRTKLIGHIKRVQDGDCWDAEQKVCELISNGIVAIIGPLNSLTSYHVASICDTLEVPHLNIMSKRFVLNKRSLINSAHFLKDPSATGNDLLSNFASKQIDYQASDDQNSQSATGLTIDMDIPRVAMAQAYIDLLKAWKWTSMVYLYEDDDSLIQLQEYFRSRHKLTNNNKRLNIKVWRFKPDKPYREIFYSLKQLNIYNIMISVRPENVRTMLKHAQQASIITENYNYLIVCQDFHTIDLEDFQYGKARIVWLKLIDHAGDSMRTLLQEIDGKESSRFFDSNIRIEPEKIRTDSALVYDAVEMLAQTLQDADMSQSIDVLKPISCNNTKPWQYGSSIVNYMRTMRLKGMTGLVQFDQLGHRSDFSMQIMRLTEEGPKPIGVWMHRQQQQQLLGVGNKNSNNNNDTTLKIEQSELQALQNQASGIELGADKEKDLLIVTSIKSEPYFMLKHTTREETGNARYEGYALDLIDELSRLVNFNYIFKEVDDGKYGKYDESIKQWNGMIKEIMIGKADLAIADLSITSSREDAVDFTLPFMNTGISILYKKPLQSELKLFSFLSPFENDVWIYSILAYVGVSFSLFFIGRISPYEWCDPHPCRQDGNRILRNQFGVGNSCWFTIAALMQQGSDLTPRSLSTRLVASVWYFFTLIMISSYTANLAAFLTVEKMLSPFEKAEELYRHPQNIKYGCVESGSTRVFFEESRPGTTYRRMFDDMVFAQTNEDGKRRVEAGNYAFFMESASIEYTVERNCNLTQIGGLLDSKGYGIALAKNSTRKRDYRTKLSEAIIGLQESGTLEILKNRWWKEKRGGGACDIDNSQSGESVKELAMANVGGIFLVLFLGGCGSIAICLLELYVKCRKTAKAHGTSIKEQLRRRWKLTTSCW